MALTKYVARTPPLTNPRQYMATEFKQVELSTNSILFLLEALGVPIELGAPNSGGAGFRMLRVPN